MLEGRRAVVVGSDLIIAHVVQTSHRYAAICSGWPCNSSSSFGVFGFTFAMMFEEAVA